jgi:hypothetical protein
LTFIFLNISMGIEVKENEGSQNRSEL